MAHEAHSLALESLRAALGERGRGALMLGADVPCVALIDAIGRRPQWVTVVLWSQSRRTADVETATAVIGAGARLLIGGPGWASARLPKKAIRIESLPAALRRLAASSPAMHRLRVDRV